MDEIGAGEDGPIPTQRAGGQTTPIDILRLPSNTVDHGNRRAQGNLEPLIEKALRI